LIWIKTVPVRPAGHLPGSLARPGQTRPQRRTQNTSSASHPASV